MTVAQILLAKYRIPQSPNLHIRCICHVVNLVVQAILATLGKADDPDKVDYFTLNKEQPLHLNINVDPDHVGLDNEEFQDEEDDKAVPEENLTLDDEEKLKATESPLSKVHILNCKISYLAYSFASAMLHHKQDCFKPSAAEEVLEMRDLKILQEKLRAQGQTRGIGSGPRCVHALELHACNDPLS